MEIDCEHHRILLELIQQVPELAVECQAFLQTVEIEFFEENNIRIRFVLGEMVSR
jgi:hypothetical protein